MIDFNAMNRTWPQKAIGYNHDLCKAAGIRQRPQILDATAGLGRDAFIFAKLGCDVSLLERHPLLADQLTRAWENLEDPILKQRLHVYHQDALIFLQDCPMFDVVYLDPMFPENHRTALAKKEMQTLQSIVGYDPDSDQLLALAKTKATRRVVVKRHKRSPFLAGEAPDLSFKGKSTRYDVYHYQVSDIDGFLADTKHRAQNLIR